MPDMPDIRKPLVPPKGQPIDLATAARLMTAYLPGIRTELRAAASIIRARHPRKPLHVREWTPQDVVRHWGQGETTGVLVGLVTLDDQGHPARWRSVLLLIDKASGELVVQDDSGLMKR